MVLVTPFYINRLGFSGYGLVSLWLMMQVLMGLLDAGMGSTLLKEFASSTSKSSSKKSIQDILKSLEIIYWVIGVVGIIFLSLNANWLSNHWLKPGELDVKIVENALILMSASLGFQFPCALYINGLMGLHQHKLMNLFQVFVNTLRYGLGFLILMWEPNVLFFFIAQVLVSIIQVFSIRYIVWNLISADIAYRPKFNSKEMKRIWRFTFGMGLSSALAVLVANSDRITLSKMVTPSEFGMYSLAITATGVLQLGIQPFYRVFFPRYSTFFAAGKRVKLAYEYFFSCFLMAGLLVPCGVVGFIFAPQIFTAWLGEYSPEVVSVFQLLLIAITLSGIGWLPAALQQSIGWANLHAWMMLLSLLIGIPLMVLLVDRYGIIGGTSIWLLHGVIDITLGIWLMHRRILRGYLFVWYQLVIVPPILISLIVTIVSYVLMPHDLGRLLSGIWILLTITIEFLLIGYLLRRFTNLILITIKKKRFI